VKINIDNYDSSL